MEKAVLATAGTLAVIATGVAVFYARAFHRLRRQVGSIQTSTTVHAHRSPLEVTEVVAGGGPDALLSIRNAGKDDVVLESGRIQTSGTQVFSNGALRADPGVYPLQLPAGRTVRLRCAASFCAGPVDVHLAWHDPRGTHRDNLHVELTTHPHVLASDPARRRLGGTPPR
ncbi:MAG: hypothetical protein AB7H43_12885 [Acidimicrobiia bacterium]